MPGSKSRTKKFINFIGTEIGNRPVTDLPGIGDAYGYYLWLKNFKTANDVLQQYLKLNKDKVQFINWLTSIIGTYGNYKNCVEDCYDALTQYCYIHKQNPISARRIVNQRRNVQETDQTFKKENYVNPSTKPIRTINYHLVEPCNGPQCKTCIHIWPCSSFTFSNTDKTYPINTENDTVLTCKSQNIIYVIFCQKHPKYQYVGRTVQKLHERMNKHRSDYKSCPDRKLYAHFHLNNHQFSDMRVVIIEKVPEWISLTEREQYWIDELNTKLKGLNERNAIKKV